MALIDFSLSNVRRFYSSMGNPSGVKGLKNVDSNELRIDGHKKMPLLFRIFMNFQGFNFF